MHFLHKCSTLIISVIVYHRQGMLTVRGCRQIVDPFPACGLDELVGELGLLIPVSLFKLAFDHGFRLRALAGLLIEGLTLCLVGTGLRLGSGAVGE